MGAKVKSKDCGRSGGNRVKSPHAHSCHEKHLPRLWRPVFTMLGAVFRKLKNGLFIYRDGLWKICGCLGCGEGAPATNARCKRDNMTIVIFPGALSQALYCCIKQAAPRSFEQAHGAWLSPFLHLPHALPFWH